MTRPRVTFPAAALIPAILLAAPVAAQEAQRDPNARLEEVERSLKSAASKAGRLSAEAESIAEERAALRQKLIDSAARIQDREQQMTESENRLVGLGREERQVKDQLAHRRSVMAKMLAALQQMEREPPPVLAVRPDDAVEAIRSAMLLATVVPQIRAEADSLSRSLRKLAALREEIVEEQRQFSLNRAQLEREQKVIESLLEVKEQLAQRNAKQRKAAQERQQRLAAEAKSLRDLLATLEAERKRAEAEAAKEAEALAEAASAADGVETKVALLGPTDQAAVDEQREAMARPDRLKPAIAFAEAQGRLALPVRGPLIQTFGADDGYGGTAKGISIETRPLARVTAPADGWVVYAGEFQGYGQLLIIDAGDGYHVLLAGMSRIDVSLSQFVLSGEPVGVMGQKSDAERFDRRRGRQDRADSLC